MGPVKSFFEGIFALLADMFNGDWMDITIGAILSVLFLAIALLLVVGIGYGIYMAIDSWFLPRQQAPGTVVGKHHSSASTTMMTSITGDGTGGSSVSVIPIYHPESWSLNVRVNGRVGGIDVNKRYYKSVRKGTKLMVTFTVGRLSQGIYIKDLSRCGV